MLPFSGTRSVTNVLEEMQPYQWMSVSYCSLPNVMSSFWMMKSTTSRNVLANVPVRSGRVLRSKGTSFAMLEGAICGSETVKF